MHPTGTLRGLTALPLVCLYIEAAGVFNRRLRWPLHLLRTALNMTMLVLFVRGDAGRRRVDHRERTVAGAQRGAQACAEKAEGRLSRSVLFRRSRSTSPPTLAVD
ncbi:hypothetical protein [Variovorax paradoxus]|uniref:hypothetical protein n=1 Tax=Variovorax paradoxus TaxID=34073 RepID=UPI002AD4C318|nr:hypothetical protein [Variovorax paradoxus]